MRVLRAFIEPIVRGAVEQKRMKTPNSVKVGEKGEVQDGECLVEHLVQMTSGVFIQFSGMFGIEII
jgi:hypothetical protein